MKRHLFAVILILALVSLAAPSWATVIYVSGDQTGTWSADTVIVTAEVRVPPGQSLTILPGVEVLFSVYCKLIVDHGATLRAVGTEADSIRFDALQDTAHWHGIRFLYASDSSRLEYCHLTHGLASGGGGDEHGGAIYCSSSSPTISNNTISGNSTIGPDSYGGGISCWNNSSPNIRDNTISGNSTGSTGLGGGIFCANSSPSISGNTISVNSASYHGGGISCYSSNPTINDNTISENSGLSGGGIFCEVSSPSISNNIISGNSAMASGGGIFCSSNSNPSISNNTFSGNGASSYGGGIFCYICSPTLVNCILWENNPQQIYVQGGTPQVTYSDIQGGYTGIGNINSDPLFVAGPGSNFYLSQLAAGQSVQSPCVDAGDPASPMVTGTTRTDGVQDQGIVDMGYHHATFTVTPTLLDVTLTPINPPITIPRSGGSFNFNLSVIRTVGPQAPFVVWCRIKNPNGTYTAPTLGPVTINTPVGVTITRQRTQTVPGSWVAGLYTYLGYVNPTYGYPAMDSSSFTWTKSATADGGSFVFEAECFGEPFPGEEAVNLQPTAFSLLKATPNPFNPTTAISYELRTASFVSLRVYDTAGRLAAELINGWRDAGSHEITFDGSGLPSGIYFAKLAATEGGLRPGDLSQVQKMVLMK